MTPRTKQAIDIFLDAVNNGTLAKGTCIACAVGNMFVHGQGGKIKKSCNGVSFYCNTENYLWNSFFETVGGHQKKLTPSKDFEAECLDITGFCYDELAEIEYTFETNTRISFTNYHRYPKAEIRADQIRGLEAVVSLMLRFDGSDQDVREVFTERAETIPVPS